MRRGPASPCAGTARRSRRSTATLLTALLAADAGHLRDSEFGDGPRAGFCLMGACQDCWVVVEGRGRVRACATMAEDGMEIRRG